MLRRAAKVAPAQSRVALWARPTTNGRVQIGATTREWHAQTVSWRNQVDTIGDLREWPEAGGGPFVVVGEGGTYRPTKN